MLFCQDKEIGVGAMERKRIEYIDWLRIISAIAVIGIHITMTQPNNYSVQEIGKSNYTILTCVYTLIQWAVPVFLMISGNLLLHSNISISMLQCCHSVFRFFICYVRKIFTGKSILKFLVLNESPLAGHLWYLGAILYVLVIVLLVDRFNCKKVLYYLTPVLLIADLVFGKYSLLIFHREFPYILVRNFLCVGIPYFCIGNLIREKRCSEKWNRKILQVLIVVFTITSLAAPICSSTVWLQV